MHHTQPLTRYRTLIENGLRAHLPQGVTRCASALDRAVEYAVFPGGKRLRPALTLLGAEVAGCAIDQALPAACAVEYLHTSSLIFDDLPAMDDADMRRGRLSLHLCFGEDVALLAALTLLNRAYAIFGTRPLLIAEAAACIGEAGMIGGQSIDLQAHSSPEFRSSGAHFASRNQKTTALMRLTLVAGVLASGAPPYAVEALAHCGRLLGEAYQIYDDLLDRFSPLEATGKTAGQDERHQRPNHLTQSGTEGCRAHLAHLVSAAKLPLTKTFGETAAVAALSSAIDSIVMALPASLGLPQQSVAYSFSSPA